MGLGTDPTHQWIEGIGRGQKPRGGRRAGIFCLIAPGIQIFGTYSGVWIRWITRPYILGTRKMLKDKNNIMGLPKRFGMDHYDPSGVIAQTISKVRNCLCSDKIFRTFCPCESSGDSPFQPSALDWPKYLWANLFSTGIRNKTMPQCRLPVPFSSTSPEWIYLIPGQSPSRTFYETYPIQPPFAKRYFWHWVETQHLPPLPMGAINVNKGFR